MWRWHSIVNRKTAWDAQKGRVYAKVGKIITIAARKWSDPDLNPALALALQKAKQYNLPKDVVERAIKKWSGTLEGEDYTEVFYEWYGPGGVALYIKVITSNTNRSATNVRVAVQKHGWSMWSPWSVSWQFHHRGVIIIDWLKRIELEKWKNVEYVDPYNKDELEMDAMEFDIEDIVFEDSLCVVTTNKETYLSVDQWLRGKYHIVSSDLSYIPENTVSLNEEETRILEKIQQALEEDDDVDSVYTNVE